MKTIHDFPPGTRVRLHTRPHCLASLPGRGLYMHIGALPYISGVILPDTPGYLAGTLFFKPDGWPFPPDVWPQGFGADIARLEQYDGPPLIAPITNGIMQPYAPEQVQALVNEHLEKLKGI